MTTFQTGQRTLGPPIFKIGGPRAGSVPPEPPTQWYDPIVAILTSGGATGYLWLHETGIAGAVGQPVAAWTDTSGAAIWEQPGVSSLRPILQASGLVFDGIDDRMNGAAGMASILAGSAWSMALGWSALSVGATRIFWSITDNATTARINPLTNTARLSFVPSASIFTISAPATSSSLWYTRNGTAYARRLAGMDETTTSGASPVGLNTLTLGARRTPGAGIFLPAIVAWVALTTRTLSSADMLAIEDILTANGYPI